MYPELALACVGLGQVSKAESVVPRPKSRSYSSGWRGEVDLSATFDLVMTGKMVGIKVDANPLMPSE